MKEEMLIEVIKSTIIGEEHLGDNLKEQCVEYINNLQSQLKAKEEVIDKLKKHCEIEINASNHYLENHSSQQELCHKVAHQRILEILSKGENK